MECLLGIMVSIFGVFMLFLTIIDPDSITTKDRVLMIVMGVMFVILGTYVYLSNRKNAAARRRFKKKGIFVEAEIIGIEQKMNWLYNGQHPYIINCQWTNPETGKTYKYRTGKFLDNPEQYIQGIPSFEVKIDPENPYIYKLNDQMFKDINGYIRDKKKSL